MTELIALLSTGKGTWSDVAKIIKSQPWEKVLIITNEFGKDFRADKAEVLVTDFSMPITELKNNIHALLKNKIAGLEVAVHMISGTGKEHAALLAAILSLGTGIRLVAIENEQFIDL